MNRKAAQDCQCCIVGAGPAGLILALLLARKGIRVRLLEVQGDLDRDFRGDTVHASTLEILDQIGLADAALRLPHSKIESVTIHTPERSISAVSFARLKTRFPYLAMMPQHHFLELLLEETRRYPTFEMQFNTAVTDLLEENGRVAGVRARQGGESVEIRADIVIGCDGRFSRLRKLCAFDAEILSPPMDVAWLRLTRKQQDPESGGAFYIANGRICIVMARDEQWQLGYVFPKGDFGEVRSQGIEALREAIATNVPWLADRVDEVADFDRVHLLSIKSDRLDCWHRPGLMLIGDAAHAMSPVGGVGINYAISDAVETANVITPALLAAREVTDEHLAEIQERRFTPTRKIQAIQTLIQNKIVALALQDKEFNLPLPARIILGIPYLRDIPPRILALGVNRVRLETP